MKRLLNLLLLDLSFNISIKLMSLSYNEHHNTFSEDLSRFVPRFRA